MAIVYRRIGRRSEAARYLEEAQKLTASVGDEGNAAVLMNNRANLLTTLGRYEEAREVYTQALAAHERVGSRVGRAYASAGLGQLCLWTDAFDEAELHLSSAVLAHREAGETRPEAWSLIELAHVHQQRGDLTEALSYVERARALVDAADTEISVARTAWLHAALLAERGDPDGARAARPAERDELLDALVETFIAVGQGEEPAIALARVPRPPHSDEPLSQAALFFRRLDALCSR